MIASSRNNAPTGRHVGDPIFERGVDGLGDRAIDVVAERLGMQRGIIDRAPRAGHGFGHEAQGGSGSPAERGPSRRPALDPEARHDRRIGDCGPVAPVAFGATAPIVECYLAFVRCHGKRVGSGGRSARSDVQRREGLLGNDVPAACPARRDRTAWMPTNPSAKVTEFVVTQSSDASFHMIAISVFYAEPAARR